MARAYGYTPALSPRSGDWATGPDRPAGAPATEAVLLVLRTQRGSYVPDPDFGVDFGIVQKSAPNTTVLWEAEVRRALAGLVARGWIGDLRVTVDSPSGGRLIYTIDFRDLRSGERVVPLRLVA